jgi:opacity protein-like surface antigen
MRTKNILLASSALAVLAGVNQAQAGDLYLSVFGGANFLNDQSVQFVSSGASEVFSSNANTGFVIGGAIGTHLDKWAKGLRTEIEASYRRNDVGGHWFISSGPSNSASGFIDANTSTFSIMANAWYDIDIGSKVRPYVGGGVGWARSHADAAFVETSNFGGPVSPFVLRNRERESSGFAWQLGLGFNYEVMPDVDLGIGYRYMNAPSFGEIFFVGKGSRKLDNENHEVSVSLTFGIN